MTRVIPRSSNGHLPTFRPHPLLAGPHHQTIAGLLLPSWTPPLIGECLEVPLPDGDRLAIHVNEPDVQGTDTIVLLLHGLAGCHASGYIRRAALKLVAQGFTVIRADLRGCGAGWTWARNTFHAGRTSDLRHVIEFTMARFPRAAIDLVGYSLGGHLVLKYLGELRDRLPPQLRGALVIGPPLDLACCSARVQMALSGIYDRYFAHKLWSHYRQRMKAGMLPDLRVRRPKTLFEFDDQVTARLAGFDSAENYYSAVSSHGSLAEIRVPTEIITTADDPMIPLEMVRSAAKSAWIRVHEVAQGGHLGFIADRPYPADGSSPIADRRWLDWQVVAWARRSSPFACDVR